MALLTDKATSDKLKNRLDEFSEYGMTLYYLYENNRTSISDLKDIFFSKDDEKSSFIYGKIIRQIKTSDLKKSFESYSIENSIEDKKELNLLYTRKIIDLVLSQSKNIDKTYINTYNYLLTNKE